MASLVSPFGDRNGLFFYEKPAPAQQGTNVSALPQLPLILPATYRSVTQDVVTIDDASKQSLGAFFEHDLDVSRLNAIHKHLWCAGLERPARSLREQICLGREIIVTEKADLHLLWEESRITIKPLPDYLLCKDIWKDHLCQEQRMFESAAGFLLSYVWLIGRESDMRVAHSCGLISSDITWETWRNFASVIVKSLDHKNLANINIRYRRGELRLDRINWIYRLCSRTRTPTNIFRGYHYAYHNYNTFFGQNLAWLASATIYVALVLTAMQVGLATDRLQGNVSFQNASYGFTVFSIVAPLIVVGALSGIVLLLVAFNWRYTMKARRAWSSTAIDDSSH